MDNQNILEIMNQKMWIQEVQDMNQVTEKFGLSLTKEDIEMLITAKSDTLKAERRIEFGESILPKIIFTFCDSSYISQRNYADTLARLQEIFFLYKNEMMDEITDDELLSFMKEQFEEVCFGDLDYLEGTCLEIFAEAIRAGYQGFIQTQGKGEFAKVDIVKRWDKQLYLETLENLFGR